MAHAANNTYQLIDSTTIEVAAEPSGHPPGCRPGWAWVSAKRAVLLASGHRPARTAATADLFCERSFAQVQRAAGPPFS